jgi:uncharacterized protein YsxB (DUF464 family)
MRNKKDRLKIMVIKDKHDFVREVTVNGHAGYSACGTDIVCAAISVLSYTLAGALEDLAGLKNSYTEKDGYMKITINKKAIALNKIEKVKTMVDTIVFGYRQTAESYKDYIEVCLKEKSYDEEVNSND